METIKEIIQGNKDLDEEIQNIVAKERKLRDELNELLNKTDKII